MKLRWSARTDVGRVRDHNEDAYGAGQGPPAERMGKLLVVCDGMGGHASGEVASRVAVETILTVFYGDETDDRSAVLEQAFVKANAAVYTRGRGKMGTTGVAALLYSGQLTIANVGDSRAYLLRDGALQQISRDHSFVSDQVAAGLITADEARVSPVRNVITRALGHQSDVAVDLFTQDLKVGDCILLSSDGMHGLVSDQEIAKVVAELPPEEAAGKLIDMANEYGGSDNITVILICIEELDAEDQAAAEPAAEEADHEADTEPLTPIDVATVGGAAAEAPAPEPARPSQAPAAAAPQSAAIAAPPPERRLSRLGGLLAALVLVALVAIIALTLNTPSAAPAPATALPAATTSATASATPATPTP